MKSRRETHKKQKRLPNKILIGILFLLIVFAGSINIAFADEDISAILSNWFNQKGSEAIAEVDESIDIEKDEQTKRLEKELRKVMEEASGLLKDFTEKEKEIRIEKLRTYTDELIVNFEIDDSDERDEVVAEIEQVVQDAIEKVDHLVSSETNGQDKEESENEDD